MEPWQEKLFIDIESGGFKPSEMTIMMSGRGVGKSIVSSAVAWKRMMDDIYNRPVEDLILTEGRIHGSKYHCVEPKGGSWLDMESWCHNTFGEPGEMWPKDDFNWPDNMRWAMNNRKFWFKDEADRLMFVMKWR